MEILGHLLDGFLVAFEPLNLLLVVIGVAVGLFIGAMPGLGSVNGVAILLPMTFLVPPTSAVIFLAAIYYGAMYGGAISSIMLGIPGASTAVATTFDGRPMALKGLADKALIAAALASFFGGTISILLFTGFAPALAHVALDFGDPEIFALMLLAFATFVGLGGDDIPKTIFSICIGLVFSSVGMDIISGEPRLVFFDIIGFMHGINFLVLAIGIYGIGEMMWTIEVTRGNPKMSEAVVTVERTVSALRELLSTWKTALMGSVLGFFVGILPAAGATPGSLMAYGVAKMTSRKPEEFGKGEVAGVVAPEAANNAASTGAMLPMLTLGIPGSPTTAILLGGMVIWGLTPGPRLFLDETEFVWGLTASLYAANLFAVVINICFIPVFLWMLKMPFTVLAPIIFVLCLVGGYAPTQDMHDIWLMLGFGVGGYLLRKLDYPLAPAVLAIVLGPIAEPALRQSLMISNGDFSIFVTRPISGPITIIAIILIFLPVFQFIRKRSKKNAEAGSI
ncbi:MAG: tripartite tricarboxylate transporter permease [Rhodospirillaceae bacterium]|jgi:putative tricarboxylic transport membrane protein|nr:tripartite tricarboxylate transporter permease [Rhodospirillaceae bacterium]MBT6138123.1 tripartite tricarboxylate transporter permease [Rhodospirillaceae bacterium]